MKNFSWFFKAIFLTVSITLLFFSQNSFLGRLLILIFYIYGSIPFAFIFTYVTKGEIIYKKGTMNVGVANAFGVGGLPAGFLTVMGETSKALLPLIISNYYFDGDLTTSLIFIFSAMLGTSFSIFLKGKGGMGRTILIWTLLILAPISAILLGAIWLAIYKICKDSYYSSIINNFLIPVVLLPTQQSIPFAIFGLSATTLFYLNFDRSKDAFAYFKATRKFRNLFARNKYIINVASVKGDSQVGCRASKLNYLKKKGFRIPGTYVCNSSAYEEYTSGSNYVLTNLEKEIENSIDVNGRYCIRPSANMEDATSYSFAGQFESYLNMKDAKSIVQAIENIWQSTRGDKVTAYVEKIGNPGKELKMAVIIQEMINPEFSGLVFTKNPINGMDEVIVESVFGFADALVQGGVTPDRWVYKWGEWIERSEDKEDILSTIKEVVIQARKIAEKYGKPVNLEWVYDGKDIYWLQLREITTLRNINLYSNKISKEFMPGIIKPLIWSVNIPVVNSSWKKLFVELIGNEAKDIDINNLAKAFYYRAYFNMGVVGDIFEILGMPRESVELLMGIELAGSESPKFKPGARTFKYIPRMVLFALKKSMYAKEIEKFLVSQRKKYAFFGSQKVEKLNERETLECIDELMEANKEASYFNIITQLLMGFYNTMLKRQLDKVGVNIQEVDFAKVKEKLRDIDPSYHLSLLHDKYDELPRKLRRKIQEMSYQSFLESPETKEFRKEFDSFLSRFGHLSDSGNDFSKTTWRETPELILKMIMVCSKPERVRTDKKEINALVKGPIKGMFLKYLYRKAAEHREYRERVTFIYTYGYGLFRPYFLHLGKLFKEKSFLADEQDIFYLTLDEIKDLVQSDNKLYEYTKNLEKRKTEVVKYKDVVLPGLICGDVPPELLIRNKVSNKLRGVATSRGYSVGRIKVVRGIQDFNKIKDGDILAIPYSDVSWTPLFSKARAVISESGGMLSHCSIVAREYSIPAVVSVKGATELEDNALVAVDGYNGEVLIIE